MPSTLLSNDIGSFSTPHRFFHQAIKALVYRTIISQSSFIPFGSVIISKQSGKLLHVEPILFPSGDLYIKVFSQSTSLFNISLKELLKAPPRNLYLAPLGISATFIESIPTPVNIVFFHELLCLVSGVADIPPPDSSSGWGLFETSAKSSPIPWPLEYVFFQPSNLSTKNYAWILSNDIMTDLETRVSKMKSLVNNMSTQETINTAYINHPSNKPEPSAAIESDAKKTAGSSVIYPTPPDPNKVRTEGDTVESSNWTPAGFNSETWGDLDEELFGNEEITEDDFNFFDDQKEKKKASIMHKTIEEEPDIEDLNFSNIESQVQLSLQKNSTDPRSLPSKDNVKDPQNPSNQNWNLPDYFNNLSSYENTYQDPKLKKKKKFVIEVQPNDPDNPDPGGFVNKRHRTSIFSPLRFSSVIVDGLDSKYSKGGRFFVSDSESEEDEEDGSVKQLNKTATDNDPEKANQLSSNADKPLETFMTPDPLTNVIGSYQDAATPDWLGGAKTKRKLDEFQNDETMSISNDWLELFSNPETVSKSKFLQLVKDAEIQHSDVFSLESVVNTLLEQVIWDDELMKNVISLPIIPQQPDQRIVGHIGRAFPSIQRLTLLDAIALSGTQFGSEQNSAQSVKTTNPETISSDKPIKVQSNDSDSNYRAQSEKPETTIIKFIDDYVFSLPPPHFSFIRMEQVLKARSPILRFWKIFGLHPRYGQKDIVPILLHPSGRGVNHFCTSFLTEFKFTYENCGLGEVELVTTSSINSGVVPVPCNTDSDSRVADTYRDFLTPVINDIVGKFEDKHIVFMFTHPIDSISTLAEISSVILHIKHQLSQVAVFDNLPNHASFQVIPLSFFADKNKLVTPTQFKMIRLALTAYDRCQILGKSIISPLNPPGFELSCQRRCPAFTLARMPPPRINFKLTESPSSSLLDEDSFIHIAYSLSNNGKWLVASWSDQWGEITKIQAFCLSDHKSHPKTFEGVCGEIWKMTLGLLKHVPVQWRVALAKIGSLEEEEIRMWIRFSESSSDSTTIACILSVDLNPSLIVSGDLNLFPHSQFQQSNLARSKVVKDLSTGTPITPQRGMEFESPDTYVLNATPPSTQINDSEKVDLDSISIVDVKNDVYGLVFRNSVGTVNPSTTKALAMGYLLKPGIEGAEQKLLEIAFVYCTKPSVSAIKNLLTQYRGLACLSSFTGISSIEDSIAPWHIEAIDKAQRTLLSLNTRN